MFRKLSDGVDPSECGTPRGMKSLDRVPGDGVRAAVFSRSPAGFAGQASTAGSLKIGSSLNGAIVSRVM